MSSEIVNLRRFKRAKARAAKADAAAEGRARSGRTRAERVIEAAERTRADRTLDLARRDLPPTLPTPANEPTFPKVAAHDGDDDLDAGNVS